MNQIIEWFFDFWGMWAAFTDGIWLVFWAFIWGGLLLASILDRIIHIGELQRDQDAKINMPTQKENDAD